jgi:hypothetical protein
MSGNVHRSVLSTFAPAICADLKPKVRFFQSATLPTDLLSIIALLYFSTFEGLFYA